MDTKRWEEAIREMRKAIAEEPQASEKRITISGVFTSPYLPHFYLGWALYQASRDNCEEALREWEISERQGVILRSKKYQNLLEARQSCHDHLLPPAMAAAQEQMELASVAAERLAELLRLSPDPALEDEQRVAREKLDQARGKLASDEAGSQLKRLREAESLATEAQRLFGEMARYASRAAAQRVDPSPDRKAIARAEDADEEVRGRATQTLDQQRRQESQPQTYEAPPAGAETAGGGGRPPGVERPLNPAVPAEVGRLAETAERLLGLIGTAATGSRLLEAQRSKLTLLILEARQRSAAGEAAALERLEPRLSASMTALQVIAGARAYLSGDPHEAIEILSLREVPSGRLAAQVHLFLAAARFSLYKIGGDNDEALLQQAAADVWECSRLDEELLPGPRRFPPPFRAFFAEHRVAAPP